MGRRRGGDVTTRNYLSMRMWTLRDFVDFVGQTLWGNGVVVCDCMPTDLLPIDDDAGLTENSVGMWRVHSEPFDDNNVGLGIIYLAI